MDVAARLLRLVVCLWSEEIFDERNNYPYLATGIGMIYFAKASASGEKLENYLLQLIKKDAELPSLRDLFADVRADIET